MPAIQRPDRAPAALSDLVKKCKDLCGSAEDALAHLPEDRESFLSTNLGDVLAQLELVLRAVGQQSDARSRKEERKSFLRKLFRRSTVDQAHPLEAPDFDVTRQGLQGNSATVPLNELLSFLAFGRKTGVLWVDTPRENFLVGLVDGAVRHAASDSTPEGLRLGEVLVGLGFLTRRQLERFVGTVEEDGTESKISGEQLVSGGMISADELRRALEHQVQQLVRRLVEAPTALFRFREGMEVLVAHRVTLDVNHLLLESARAQDEAANAGLRELVVEDDWQSWQGELSEEVREATGVDLSAEPAAPMPSEAARAGASASADGDEADEETKATSKDGSSTG